MLLDRQRLLLTLLDALREPVCNTDFQKLLFFYTQECEQTPTYEFVPYKFGGFSFTSYADKRRLAKTGLLVQDDQRWELTDSGRKTARKEAVVPLVVAGFCRRYTNLRGNALIAEQYRKHPYYAIRSEIIETILPDAASRNQIATAHPADTKASLFTIGYEGKSLERFLNQLLQAGVTLLCDVRRNPISRKFGFSKNTLSKACEGVGVRYEHLPELGIDSQERRDLNNQADYDALFADYERKSLPQHKDALTKIRSWVKADERVALTCYELLPQQCHRHCVAEALVRNLVKLPIVHL